MRAGDATRSPDARGPETHNVLAKRHAGERHHHQQAGRMGNGSGVLSPRATPRTTIRHGIESVIEQTIDEIIVRSTEAPVTDPVADGVVERKCPFPDDATDAEHRRSPRGEGGLRRPLHIDSAPHLHGGTATAAAKRGGEHLDLRRWNSDRPVGERTLRRPISVKNLAVKYLLNRNTAWGMSVATGLSVVKASVESTSDGACGAYEQTRVPWAGGPALLCPACPLHHGTAHFNHTRACNAKHTY